jgi:hypothetical protein
MAICHFCEGRFQSDQGVKSHMKRCAQYQTEKSRKLTALGSLPKGALRQPRRPPFKRAHPSRRRISRHRCAIL